MFQGLDHVGKAVQILVSRNATLNQRLYEAAHEFSAAMRRPDQWPADLLEKATVIEQKLTVHGAIGNTVNGMDIATASQIAAEILDLSVAVSAASIHEMKKHISALPTRRPGRKTRLHARSVTA